jgi:DNA-binding MarR family transcriptional regulator
MPLLMLKDLPRYECLLEAAKTFPGLDPSACEVFLHLLRAGDEAFKSTDEHLARHQISHGRFTVLLLLLDKAHGCPHPHTPAELADMACVTRATMTGLIDTLERDGLVTRTPDPNDRRMMSVSLTAHGQARLEKILPGHFQCMAKLVAPLSEPERRTLVGLLTKILEHASDSGAAQPATCTHIAATNPASSG